MKLKSRFAYQAFVACMLISGLFFVPAESKSQTPLTTHALISTSASTPTDVSAYLLYDHDLERYTLTGINPSKRKLKIYFYAGGTKYVYRVSSDSFSKPFDLKGADDGVYSFAVQDGKTILKTDVKIETRTFTKREAVFASRL